MLPPFREDTGRYHHATRDRPAPDPPGGRPRGSEIYPRGSGKSDPPPAPAPDPDPNPDADLETFEQNPKSVRNAGEGMLMDIR